jgi:hypothetical protein
MGDFFATLVLGHLIGDFLLQNKWMAMNKSASHFKCFIHCVLYTLAVTATTWPTIHGWLWSSFIFLSHYPIDRWSLADKWLDFIGGRNLPDFYHNGHINLPTNPNVHFKDEWPMNYRILRGGFACVVYTAADNTMHLALMFYGAKFLLAYV